MSNLKKFKVTDFDCCEVILEVNLDVLSPELSTEINDFWSGCESRLDDEDGDAVRTVIRLFGEYSIRYFLQEGGINLDGPIGERNIYFTKEVLSYVHEGLPDFDHLGIVIFSASVDVPTFETLTLEEV